MAGAGAERGTRIERILLQLDTDRHASAFDAITAYDAGVDRVLSYAAVRPPDVRDLLYGAIFARSQGDLQNSAVFIGGSDIIAAEALLRAVRTAFVGTLCVSVMLDAGGCNTTAAAAVTKTLSACRGEACLAPTGQKVVVLAGTGPVGRRTAALLALLGAEVTLSSRRLAAAQAACDAIQERFGVTLHPAEVQDRQGANHTLEGAHAVLTTGAPGVMLLPAALWQRQPTLRVLADVNAIPPLGIEGIQTGWNGVEQDGKLLFGAYAIGELKKRTHRACLAHLFERSDAMLDAEEILAIAREVGLCAS
jgi:hypothetical protein